MFLNGSVIILGIVLSSYLVNAEFEEAQCIANLTDLKNTFLKDVKLGNIIDLDGHSVGEVVENTKYSLLIIHYKLPSDNRQLGARNTGSRNNTCCYYGDENCTLYAWADEYGLGLVAPYLLRKLSVSFLIQDYFKDLHGSSHTFANALHICWSLPRICNKGMLGYGKHDKSLNIFTEKVVNLLLHSYPARAKFYDIPSSGAYRLYQPVILADGSVHYDSPKWSAAICFFGISLALLLMATSAMMNFFNKYAKVIVATESQFYDRMTLFSWVYFILMGINYTAHHIRFLKYCLDSRHLRSSIAYEYYTLDAIFGLILLVLLVIINIVEYHIAYHKIFNKHTMRTQNSMKHIKKMIGRHAHCLRWCGLLYSIQLMVIYLPYLIWAFIRNSLEVSLKHVYIMTYILLFVILLQKVFKLLRHPLRNISTLWDILLLLIIIVAFSYLNVVLYGMVNNISDLPPMLQPSKAVEYLFYTGCAALFAYFVKQKVKASGSNSLKEEFEQRNLQPFQGYDYEPI